MERYVEDFIKNARGAAIDSPSLTQRDRLVYAKDQVVSTFKKVFPYILVGVGIGAVIHNWIPESWVERILGGKNPFGVVLATVIGVPMCGSSFVDGVLLQQRGKRAQEIGRASCRERV